MNHYRQHESSQIPYRGWQDIFLGLFASIALLLFFYPQFVVFEMTPMHAKGWELSDPSVSWANFKPSFRVFQYELYNNFNVLWSSLRTMGMPMLANDIQAAPLFPLTLIFSWLHEDIFWNVYVSARLVLLGFGSYLLVRRFFNFERLVSIVFIISFVYALYVMRWMNNPWQNGLLSGVWYLYFLCLITEQSYRYSFKRIIVFAGMVLTVIMMVTCGFPEASVMSAILVVLTYVPFIIYRTKNKEIAWKPYIQDLLLAHLVGFALSSVQIIAIVELLAASESHRFVGLRQYGAADLIPFFAETLTRFTEAGPSLYSDSRTYLGLIPLTLFFLGLGTTAYNFRKFGPGEIGAVLCGVFITFKMFAIGPSWFNELVAKPPVLRESYFYVYFFSIFLWFFSFFIARGFQQLCNIPAADILHSNRSWRILLLFAVLAILTLLWFAAPLVTGKNLWHLLIVDKHPVLLKVLILFSFFALTLQAWLYLNKYKIMRLLVPCSFLLLIMVENRFTLPKDFYAWRATDNTQLENVLKHLQTYDTPLNESRIIDRNGTYVSHGLATIDTGATPLLPRRTQVFRTNFFRTIRAGHLSIENPKSRYSWGLTSTNLRALDRYYGGGEELIPIWQSLDKKEGGEIHLDLLEFNGEPQIKDGVLQLSGGINDFFYFRGWAIGNKMRGLKSTTVYIVFKNESEEISAPVRKAVRHDVAGHLGSKDFIMAGWDSYISASALKQGDFKILIRFVDELNNSYYERNTGTEIHFSRKNDDASQPFLFGVGEIEKIFLGVLDQYYIYLDSSALPRAYIASKCKSFDSMKQVVETFKTTTTFQLGDGYLEHLGEQEKEFCIAYSSTIKRVPILKDGGDELLLDVVQGPAIIILNDNLYPGWEAYDKKSGASLEIKPANITFRSVVLPEDKEYQITYSYRPKWLYYSLGVTLLGIIGFILPVVVGVKASLSRN